MSALEFGQHYQRAAQVKEGHDDTAQTANVSPRHADQRAFVIAQCKSLLPVEARMDRAEMGQRCALRPARRARRVEYGKQCFLIDRRRGRRRVVATDGIAPR